MFLTNLPQCFQNLMFGKFIKFSDLFFAPVADILYDIHHF